MAKKARQSQKKGGKKKPPAKGKRGASGAGKARKGPRSQALPGMEQVRSQRLDNICESIVEERTRMNKAKTEETGLVQSALQEMTKRGIPVYRHGGVELARIPGAEKLRVRLTKEQGDAGEADLNPPDADENPGGGGPDEEVN